MYTGHFATALVVKSRVPKAPSWALFVGAGLLDFLFSAFILLKWEVWTPDEVSIPWSHSLVTSLAWSVIFGLLFYKNGKRVVIAVAIACFLHFVLDYFVHPAHLQIAPGVNYMLGMDLGQSRFSYGWFLELLVILGCCTYYIINASKNVTYGKNALWLCAIIFLLHLLRAALNM